MTEAPDNLSIFGFAERVHGVSGWVALEGPLSACWSDTDNPGQNERNCEGPGGHRRLDGDFPDVRRNHPLVRVVELHVQPDADPAYFQTPTTAA